MGNCLKANPRNDSRNRFRGERDDMMTPDKPEDIRTVIYETYTDHEDSDLVGTNKRIKCI
jgi:hypothetical protein